MSDSEPDSNAGLLSEFFLGPAWARASSTPQIFKPRAEPDKRRDDGPPRRDERGKEPRGRDDRSRDSRDRDDRRGGQGRKPAFQDRRSAPPEPEEIFPSPGVRVALYPDRQAVHLVGKEIHQVARVYSLFDVAQILLAERVRCRAVFEVSTTRPPLFHGRLDGSLFLTKEEAVRHLWNSEVTKQVLEEQTIEVDPPTGRYQAVARCGLSGVWLGPPNHHAYQTNLRRLHREQFSHLPFEMYSSRVRTERSEEAVAAWLETMKTKQRWRVIGEGDDAWMEDKSAAEHAVATRCFEKAYAEVHKVEISAGVRADSISPALFASLRQAGQHAKRNPAVLIPSVCSALEAEHLPVFKRSGKLFTGPARPHALPRDVALAERPARIVEWIRNNKPAKLAGLWQAVHPDGGTEPCLEYANDLFWLLNQGHILLYSDDTLVVHGDSEAPAPAGESKRERRAKSKPQAASGTEAKAAEAVPTTPVEPSPVEETTTGEVSDVENPLPDPVAEIVEESNDLEAPPVEAEAPLSEVETPPVEAEASEVLEPAPVAEAPPVCEQAVTVSEPFEVQDVTPIEPVVAAEEPEPEVTTPSNDDVSISPSEPVVEDPETAEEEDSAPTEKSES